MNVKGDGKTDKEKERDSRNFTLYRLDWWMLSKGWTGLLCLTEMALCYISLSELVTKLTIKLYSGSNAV
jgi:hypothetical protein